MAMTLGQLKAFALVAKLGSLRAAAAELGISEPAVSSTLAALRQDLGDPLFVRSGGGIALTPGGRALAAHAEEIVGLAQKIRWDVSHAQRAEGGLRVLATAAFAEHAAGRLLDVFTKRVPSSAVDVVVESVADVPVLLTNHSYDIALGGRPALRPGSAIVSVPFLRYRRFLVASPSHPLGDARAVVPPIRLREHQWFAGPYGIQAETEEGRWLASLGRAPDIVPMSSETDALAAVRAGEGIMMALESIVRGELDSGVLVKVAAPLTPVTGLWWASTLDHARASDDARRLQRFVTTTVAMAAMVAPGGSRGLAHRGSKVHVALWS